ncbi:hypothetical protein SAY87_012053 [Trapa incisa]|uniref:Uncharacterized protein n=1 Tax=Trapa incisa TaxID=236973 RepID=A0AAN7GK86_9MYRT|nr:hypothetical protein SAY87_012053 [Trapa incisa]
MKKVETRGVVCGYRDCDRGDKAEKNLSETPCPLSTEGFQIVQRAKLLKSFSRDPITRVWRVGLFTSEIK